jgi:hypothetical protein
LATSVAVNKRVVELPTENRTGQQISAGLSCSVYSQNLIQPLPSMRNRNTSMSKSMILLLTGCLTVGGMEAQQPGTSPFPVASAAPTKAVGLPVATRKTEDFGVLAIDPASLEPLSIAILGSSETADLTRELLRVQWRSGDPVDLYVIKPRGIEKPPVILYLYGYPSDTDRFRDDGWCKRATHGGFAAVAFVSALTGQRYANRPMKEWFISELQESLGATTHDVQMILNYLAKRGDLSVNQVGMYGQGSGGTIALLAAEADPRISVVDVLDPWGDWPDWLKNSPEVPEDERANYLTPQFLERVAGLDPTAYLSHLKLKALRVEQVVDEPVTPIQSKDKIAAAVQNPGQLVRYKNEREHLNAWRIAGLSGWIRDQMRPASLSASAGP